MWVLLDGGPSRAFSDLDIISVEEDLNMLKVWFLTVTLSSWRTGSLKIAQSWINLHKYSWKSYHIAFVFSMRLLDRKDSIVCVQLVTGFWSFNSQIHFCGVLYHSLASCTCYDIYLRLWCFVKVANLYLVSVSLNNILTHYFAGIVYCWWRRPPSFIGWRGSKTLPSNS